MFELKFPEARKQVLCDEEPRCEECGVKDKAMRRLAVRVRPGPGFNGVVPMCPACFEEGRRISAREASRRWAHDEAGRRHDRRQEEAKRRSRAPAHGETWAVDFGHPHGVRRATCMRGPRGMTWLGSPERPSQAVPVGRVRT